MFKLLILIFAFSNILHADETVIFPDQRPHLFYGFSFGPSWLEPNKEVKESYKKGYQLTAKILYSKANDNFIWDIGPGFFYNYLSGTNELIKLPYKEVVVKTHWFLIEGSLRYALSKHWQIGPVINTMLGLDVGFDEYTNGNGVKASVHGGIRFAYETIGFNGLLRFGAQYLTDLSISNRQLHVAQLEIQYGFPLNKQEQTQTQNKILDVPQKPQPKFVDKVGVNNIKILLNEGILRFDTAKSTLKTGSEDILKRISVVLMKHPNEWKIVKVEGHSDIRGSLAMNDRLSAKRAKAVGNKLSEYGIPSKRIRSKGFGPRVPIDNENNEAAWLLNRRVEILLDGVINPDDLVKELLEVK